ncbi:TPA: ribosomal-processing cysteine protease Prp [Streptococcus agalactiae]
MIKATFTRNQSGYLYSAEISGHAGSGEYGFDVMCAAVSTLSINFINSLEALTTCQAQLIINDVEGGYMKIDLSSIPQHKEDKVQLLFESYLLGMTNLSKDSSEFVSTIVMTH